MNLLPLVVVFLVLLPCSSSIKYNVELAERYRKYAECLRRREEATRNDEALHVQTVEVVRGSDVVLPCFTCVAPEDGLEIENTYKPSSGSIGRAFKKVVDFFRQKLLGAAVLNKYKWTYDWEFAQPGAYWSSLTNVHSKKSVSEHISTKVRRFLNRDGSKWTLGDQYELRLKSVNRNNSGFYRCINRKIEGPKSKVARIGAMYFLDVKTRQEWMMVASNDDGIPLNVSNLFPHKTDITRNLRIEPSAGLWSSCSHCGNHKGEQFRAIQCKISSTTSSLSRQKANWIKLVGKVSCSSSLVPVELRRLYKSPKVIQYRKCYSGCFSNTTTDRIINSTDELGETRIIDYLPKGEFLFGEVLPKLLPPIIRRGYLLTEGDDLVLTCDVDPSEGIGIHWHSKSELKLTASKILKKFQGRVWLDEMSRIHFDRVELADEDMYYCYSSEEVLLGVHNVMVKENKHTAEIVSRFAMFFKFVVFTLIAVLIIRKLMG